MPTPCSPEVAKVVEHGLFVERVFGDVYNNGAVNKVADPVGPSLRIQSEVPVGPSSHMVKKVLESKQGKVNLKMGILREDR